MPSVSYSESSSYLLCRRKHYYGYTRSLKKIVESSSLMLGGAGHSVLEAFYREIMAGGDTRREQLAHFDIALSKAEKAYGEVVRLGFRDDPKKATLHDILFKFYFPNEPMVRKGYLIQAVEKEFILKLEDSELETPFVVDIIAVDPNGKTLVVDHKFVYDFYTYEQCQLQPQIPLYVGALRGMGFKIDGGAYNQLRNRKIKAPSIEQRVQWLPFPVSPVRVQQTFIDQIAVAEEIQSIKLLTPEQQDRRAFRVSNNMVCKSCSFKDICTTELNGGNTQLALKEYEVRTRRKFAEAVSEAEETD